MRQHEYNTTQYETARVQHETQHEHNLRQHECNTGQHEYNMTQQEYSTIAKIFWFIYVIVGYSEPLSKAPIMFLKLRKLKIAFSSKSQNRTRKSQANDLTAQKMKFSIKGFFSKFYQIRSFLRIWSHLLKKSLLENFFFYVVLQLCFCLSVYWNNFIAGIL